MRRRLARYGWLGMMLLATGLIGCATRPAPRTGFISDYSKLERVDDRRARYIAPTLSDYDTFLVDPVHISELNDPPVLTPEERTEIADYMRAAFERVIADGGWQRTDDAAEGVARMRFAITDIRRSTWWANLHPGSKLTGAGTGGASMEGEIVDAVTGAQLAAFVQSGRGNQFELDTFSKLDDVRDVIDAWAKETAELIRDVHERE